MRENLEQLRRFEHLFSCYSFKSLCHLQTTEILQFVVHWSSFLPLRWIFLFSIVALVIYLTLKLWYLNVFVYTIRQYICGLCFVASFLLLALYLRGTLWKVILNLLMILSFINNCSRSFSSRVIEDHQVSSSIFTLIGTTRQFQPQLSSISV